MLSAAGRTQCPTSSSLLRPLGQEGFRLPEEAPVVSGRHPKNDAGVTATRCLICSTFGLRCETKVARSDAA
jgi:hypothetical protein